MLLRHFAPKVPITTAADDIYIILADDSSCFFDVCVCVRVRASVRACVKCHLLKNSLGASSIHCCHNVYTGDYI